MVLFVPQVKQHPVFPSVPALVDITCTLLLLNPDFTTAWNVRYRTKQHVLIDVVIVTACFSLTVTQEGFHDVRQH